MSSFPAVATVIGVSKEVAESGPLLATLAIDPSIVAPPPPPSEPMEIKVDDPVTQAVVDNIIGKLPTKKEPVMIKCEVCNITVSSQEILEAHLGGAKHTKKVKSQELLKEIANSKDSTLAPSLAQNGGGGVPSQFTCKICDVTVNSHTQYQQHLTGTKHKTKEETSKSNTISVSNDKNVKGAGGKSVNIGPNRLYCAACNVHVNSDLQLHQHITSTKHANKVNGVKQPAVKRLGPTWTRGSPYRAARVGNSNGASGVGSPYRAARVGNSNGASGVGSPYRAARVGNSNGASGVGSPYRAARVGNSNGASGVGGRSYGATWKRPHTSWTPNMDLSGSYWEAEQQDSYNSYRSPPHDNFMPGGNLYTRRDPFDYDY